MPDGVPTSIGSGIFAQLAAGIFTTIEEAQQHMCLPYKTYAPRPASVAVYEQLYQLYRAVYFAFGTEEQAPPLGHVLRTLREIAAAVRSTQTPSN